MEVIFYDRANKREVRSGQLMFISLVREVWIGDSQDPNQDYLSTDKIATVGYKSEECPSYKNWDMFCNEADLVFLRLVEV